MKSGACGIYCEVCAIHTKNFCDGCLPGTDPGVQDRLKKLEAMKRLCPILACAAKNNIAYCPKECAKFPCQIFDGDFPYSKRFLGVIRGALRR